MEIINEYITTFSQSKLTSFHYHTHFTQNINLMWALAAFLQLKHDSPCFVVEKISCIQNIIIVLTGKKRRYSNHSSKKEG